MGEISNFFLNYPFKTVSCNNVTQSAAVALEDRPQDKWDCLCPQPPRSLGKHQPSWCWQADSVWWGAPVREHAIPSAAERTVRSVLMGKTGTQIGFPAEAGSENWRVPVTRPLLSSRFYTEPNQNHVCSHPADLRVQPARLASQQVLWSPEQHVIAGSIQTLPPSIVIWIPLVYNSTVVSGGK